MLSGSEGDEYDVDAWWSKPFGAVSDIRGGKHRPESNVPAAAMKYTHKPLATPGELYRSVGSGGYCSPSHPTHFEPSSLELNGTL